MVMVVDGGDDKGRGDKREGCCVYERLMNGEMGV